MEELEGILKGFVSVEFLRRHGGLRALPGKGYWGAAVIASLDRICDIGVSQPQGEVFFRQKETYH